MKIGSLFSGIGGFDLAARWMGWETSWYSEIEPFCCEVMKMNFPEAVNHGDITQIQGADVGAVDGLVGGFPCQDVSTAGKGAGLDGARSGLWTHYARIIGEVRPRFALIENVAALRTRGLDRVLQDLDALGYDAEWHCIPASYVGAPHRRDRIWIIAYPAGSIDGLIMGNAGGESFHLVQHGRGREGSQEVAPQGTLDLSHASVGDVMADAAGDGRGKERPNAGGGGEGGRTERALGGGPLLGGQGAGDPTGRGGYPAGWWISEPDMGRVAHGVPNRVERLRALGNAVVPQVVYLLYQGIEAALKVGLEEAA